MANRFLVSRLTKKLSTLQRASNFPHNPNLSPPALYVQDVLNPVNLPPSGVRSPREFYLKEIHKRAKTAWPKMDSSLKAVYETQAEKSKEKLSEEIKQWYAANVDTEACQEIKLIVEQLNDLKNPPSI